MPVTTNASDAERADQREFLWRYLREQEDRATGARRMQLKPADSSVASRGTSGAGESRKAVLCLFFHLGGDDLWNLAPRQQHRQECREAYG